MEFATSKEGIFVTQRKYTIDLLKEPSLLGCKAAETPTELNLKPQHARIEDEANIDQFQRLVGRLIY